MRYQYLQDERDRQRQAKLRAASLEELQEMYTHAFSWDEQTQSEVVTELLRRLKLAEKHKG